MLSLQANIVKNGARYCSAVFIFIALIHTDCTLAQSPFRPLSIVNAATIAGRPVALDAQKKLLPWPIPQSTGYSYSSYFLSQWTVLWDQYNRQRLPYFYCCFAFDKTTFELIPEQHWANSTGYLRAMLTGFVERLYPYTGDPHTLEFLQNFVDYELEHGLTPSHYAWANVPYASANPGSARYTGWSEHGEDFIEPHVVGEDGYAYLRLYEMTGNTRYLRAAINCANALVKNYRVGNQQLSPWANRVYAIDGKSHDNPKMFAYSSNVVEPIMLFDELIRLHLGDTKNYIAVRQGAWDWLMAFPVKNNTWVGYFEDVPGTMENMNQVIPLELARYVLLHPELDSDWRMHARNLIDWVKTTPKWPKYSVHGAIVTTEQGDGNTFCCNKPNECCDSHSARLAAVEALFYAKTGDNFDKEEAYRTFNWVSYWQGLPSAAHAPFSEQWWFTDEFADGPRRMMDAFWAVPEWAPVDESHLLGSLSVVTQIHYTANSVTYTTFDTDSTDVLRLNFGNISVFANGNALNRLANLAQLEQTHAEGYVFNEQTHVLYIHHKQARDIDIQGSGGIAPPRFVTFDAPHLAAGTILEGQYPAGMIDWKGGNWAIGAPFGKFGTFNLKLANFADNSAKNLTSEPTNKQTNFTFYTPTIFVGIDVYNDGEQDAKVTFRSADMPEQSYVIQPKALRRIRTGWHEPSSTIFVDLQHAQDLRFDNLAYLHR